MVVNSHGWARASSARGKEKRQKKRTGEKKRKEGTSRARSTAYIVIALNAFAPLIRGASRCNGCSSDRNALAATLCSGEANIAIMAIMAAIHLAGTSVIA